MLMSLYFLCVGQYVIRAGSAVLLSRFFPLTCFKGPKRHTVPHFTDEIWPCRLTLLRYLTFHVPQRLGPWSMAPQEMKNTTQSGRFTLGRLWAVAYWTAPPFTLPPDCIALKATQSWRLCSADSNIKKVPRQRTARSYSALFFPSLWSQTRRAPNFCTLFACRYWFIWKAHLFIHV